MQTLFSALLFISFFMMSCNEGQMERNDSKQETTIETIKHPLKLRDDTLLMPLTTNTAWFFDIAYQDIETGTFLRPTAEFPFPQSDTLYVHGSTMLDSNPCSLIRTSAAPKGGTWYTIRQKGVYSWPQDPEDTTEVPVFSLTYKYPARKGENYTSNGIRVEVRDTAANISVPAGSFSCFYYVSFSKAPGKVMFENHVWLSKGFGMVRNEAIMHQKDIAPVRRIVTLRRFIHGTEQKQ